MIFDEAGANVLAVLDWELSTLGAFLSLHSLSRSGLLYLLRRHARALFALVTF
jgi:hypothetical protein